MHAINTTELDSAYLLPVCTEEAVLEPVDGEACAFAWVVDCKLVRTPATTVEMVFKSTFPPPLAIAATRVTRAGLQLELITVITAHAMRMCIIPSKMRGTRFSKWCQ